jgi:hypothetical protein
MGQLYRLSPAKWGSMETRSMFDQIYFPLACGHTVVVGRIKTSTWRCEECNQVTDLTVEPHRANLERDRDAADQIDKREMARGKTIRRES